jgi:hypothetical protein
VGEKRKKTSSGEVQDWEALNLIFLSSYSEDKFRSDSISILSFVTKNQTISLCSSSKRSVLKF